MMSVIGEKKSSYEKADSPSVSPDFLGNQIN